jgi:cytochrome b561
MLILCGDFSMGFKNTSYAYGSVAKFLHWLLFILVLVMIVGGFFMDDVPKAYKGVIYNLHKLTGLTILLLMVVRWCWMMINVKPMLPTAMPNWQRKATRLVHELLYLLIIAMPLAGWIGSSSAGKPPHIGDLKLSLPIPEDKSLIEAAFNMHELIAYGIIFLVCVHAAAALYHHYIRKDDVMRRMLP